jgi:micrococcal nuclease
MTKIIMKWFSIFFIGIVLMACSAVLPDRKKNISDFIPLEEKKIEHKKCSKKVCNFAQKHYPNSCKWTELERVVDGDTIIITGKERVRFIGIDTPEEKHPHKPIQPFALEATDTLKKLLSESKKICLISDSIGDAIDKYGRTLAYIFTDEGKDVNAELLRLGMAKGYFYFPFERKEEFGIYETQAKKEKIGQWK